MSEFSQAIEQEHIDYGRFVTGEGLPSSYDEYSGGNNYLGVSVGLGWKLTANFSVGAQATINYPVAWPAKGDAFFRPDCDNYITPRDLGGAFSIGVIGHLLGGRIILDVNTQYVMMRRYYLDLESDTIVRGTRPSNVTLSMSGEAVKNTLFFSLKSSVDIFRDSTAKGINLKETPVVEFWPVNSFGVRTGYHLSWLAIDAETALGHGFLVGAAVKVGNRDIDLNYTRSQETLTGLEGQTVPYGCFLIGIGISSQLKLP